jgi:hypothetical protein
VYASVTRPTFYNLIEHIKADNVLDSEGKPDLGRVLEGLIIAYAEGRIKIPMESLPNSRLLSSLDNPDFEDNKWNR